MEETAENYKLLYELFSTRPYSDTKSFSCVKEFTPAYPNIVKEFKIDGTPPQIRTENNFSF